MRRAPYILTLLALAICGALLPLAVPSALAYKSPKYCTPDATHPDTYCRCLIWHPKEEFCADPRAPLPSCCRATERNSKVTLCACCRSVYGSKRDISVDERGWYEHGAPVVEYDIK